MSTEAARRLVVNSSIWLPADEIRFRFVRSSGPGGQRVNKVSTKAVLRWDLAANVTLPREVKARFMKRFGNRITGEGHLLITSERYRDQRRNAEDCRQKLSRMLSMAAIEVKPRKKTGPSLSSRRRRLHEKRAKASKKELRRSPKWEE